MLTKSIERLELSEEHARWLEDTRKLSSEVAAKLGIVSTRDRRIAFEYRRNGELIWRQVRIPEKDGGKRFLCFAPDGRTTLSEAGIALSFWQEDSLCDPSTPEIARVITEGQFDTAALEMAGVPFVGSVPNGAVDRMGEGEITAAEDRQFQYLWEGPGEFGRYKLRGGLAVAKKIILATDADKAGSVLREELAIRLGRHRCWYVTYPEGCKDANDVLVKYGVDEGCELLMDVIADARPMVPNKLVKYSDIPERKRVTHPCGWPELNPHLRIARPEFIVLTGPPGDGKSQFALALGANLAYQHQWPGAVIQFEDDVERNRVDLRRYWRYRHRPDNAIDLRVSEADAAEADKWIDRYFRTISPNEEIEAESINLDWLDANLAEAVNRHGCRWALIDPWNEIEHVFGRGQTEAQYLNEAVRRLKRTARRLQIVLMIVAHPDKGGGQETDIDNWSLYNMAGGAVWNNKADHGIVVYRPDDDKPESYIKIAKSKQHSVLGRPGIVTMGFVPKLGTYEFVRKGV